MRASSAIVKGDKFVNQLNSKIFKVIEHHKDDVLFLLCLDTKEYCGYHLFYDEPEDIEFAKNAFNIDMNS